MVLAAVKAVVASKSLSKTCDGLLRVMSARWSWWIKFALTAAIYMTVPTQAYALQPATVSITSSAETVASGENFQLTITVTAAVADGMPTGTLTLYDGTIQLGVFDILFDTSNSALQVQLTTTPNIAGPYTFAFSVMYSGDSIFAPATSPTLNVDVTQTASYSAQDIIQAVWIGQQVGSVGATGSAQDFGAYGSSSVVDYVNYLDQTATGPWGGVDVSLAATPGTVAEGEAVLLQASVIPGSLWDPVISVPRRLLRWLCQADPVAP